MPNANDPYAAIKALRDKTIPGPWGVIQTSYDEDNVTFLIVDSDDSRVAAVEIAHEGDAKAVQGAEADAHFIADSRTWMDLLLQEVETLREELHQATRRRGLRVLLFRLRRKKASAR
ncbi:hypothetical protein ACQEVG_21545 [Streptomyces sp. CA-135486]|uniref:hypothetical protein n=1 Tax=Streptomyces sp. CA-135486 TaxID=3240049 RepID=UPI003D8E50C7